jgi:GxxExxY protein
MKPNELTQAIIGAAIEVHRETGPGLLESTYEMCLCRELSLRDIEFRRELELPVHYKGVAIDCGYRVDVVVEEQVMLELKAVAKLLPIHEAQLHTYMKLGGWKLGLLMNFNVPLMKDGIRRRVLDFEE